MLREERSTVINQPRPWRGLTPRCLAVAALGSTGCMTGGSGAYLPPSPPVVRVVMQDYRFEHRPTLPSGRVVLQAPNEGTVDHEMVVAGLTEDFPPIDEQLRGEVRRAVRSVAVVAPTPPGRTGIIAVDLTPGRYALICFVTDPDGVEHSLKGMSSEFRVQ